MAYLKVIDDFLSPEECNNLIDHFEHQPTQLVDRMNAEYERVEMDNPLLAKLLWNRLQSAVELPTVVRACRVVGLNERFRFSKYHPGMEFQIHKDGVNQNRRGHRSVMTLNIFLNDDFDGGETDFYHSSDPQDLRYSIKPATGRAGLFDGQQFHAGNMVTRGFKYLLRTDVMVE